MYFREVWFCGKVMKRQLLTCCRSLFEQLQFREKKSDNNQNHYGVLLYYYFCCFKMAATHFDFGSAQPFAHCSI